MNFTKKILLFQLLVAFQSFAQESNHQFHAGLESNGQWYINDNGLKDKFGEPTIQPEKPLRSNTYLLLNYSYKRWNFGIQGESYQDMALLNMNPKYYKNGIGTYFAQYKGDKFDVTLGYFYEQFGSGLLFRTWEDRTLGINNALRGARVNVRPFSFMTIKSLIGRQRTGFDVTDNHIYGTDAEIDLADIFKFKQTQLSFGLTYVGRDEASPFESDKFNTKTTNAYGARVSFNNNGYYFSSELDYKANDIVVQQFNQVEDNLVKPGSGLLVNFGYSKKGFGFDATFRRIENMDFFSERAAKGNNFNDKILNFVPSLTKQHHLSLANIYVFQAQPGVMIDKDLVKNGEIGGQVDIFYDFKKGTALGGKYGTKVSVNFSNWNALPGDFYVNNPQNYGTKFFGLGERYFTDGNIEITKKISNKWLTVFSYINQYYDNKLIASQKGQIRTHIVGGEATYKFNSKTSIRGVAEHLWADSDRKNWASALLEFNLNSKISFFVSDMNNYGNDDENLRMNHYFNGGMAIRKGTTRLGINFGRQRGGLVCVGGVCRMVPESSGLTINLNTSI
ncbi:MAG: DUF6029 family protein [Limnohabitans sp.]|nr:DUF6029 family protein [Limnohabitans sp.]